MEDGMLNYVKVFGGFTATGSMSGHSLQNQGRNKLQPDRTPPMTETVPERIHVRWGKAGDVRVAYMEERFWSPDAEADYVPLTALEAAQSQIAELKAQLEDYKSEGY